jgi:hypothetical protein
MSSRHKTLALALVCVSPFTISTALAHAVCGDRIFPATLAIDDPGVNDELALPTLSWVPNNGDGTSEFDASSAWTKTITPGLGISISSGPTWQHPGGYGWAALDTELKYNFLCIPQAEFMASVGFDVTWAGTGTGTQAGAGSQNTYAPVLNAGMGFGTLPESMKYLRPFAITSQFDVAAPGRSSTNDGDPIATTFDWGFTLQYSLPYFNAHVARPTRPTFSPLASAADASTNRRCWPFCLDMLSNRIISRARSMNVCGGLMPRARRRKMGRGRVLPKTSFREPLDQISDRRARRRISPGSASRENGQTFES